MWHTTWKSLLAHKVRLSLTALAVVLGVAFVSGTLVLTDTLKATFDTLFADAYDGVDVAVRGEQEFTSQPGMTTRTPVTPVVLEEVINVDGVAAAEGEVQGTAQLLDADGQPLGSAQAPALGGQAPELEELYAARLRDGRYPTVAGEVAIDAGTAEASGLSVGDTVEVVAGGPVTTQSIVGVFGYGEADNLAGATLTLFDPDTAFELFAQEGGYAAVNVKAEEGVNRDDLRDRVAAAVGGDWDVLTGAELSESASDEVAESLGFFNTALLVFAGISLFVGAFIIFNTFSIIVAQRTRELALLRAVGASRRQILRSVLAEAFATGVFGSVVGIGLGLAVASGLRSMLNAFDLSLPEGALVFETRTVVVGLLLGVVVTTLAAVGPAFKAVRIPPVAALQAVAAPPARRFGRVRDGLGMVALVLGIVLLALGLFADAGIPVVGAGAVVVMIGMAMLASLVTRPIVAALGYPVAKALGVRGDLARQNALRNPKRTAATASALMIGLGLVSFVMIFGASITASTAAAIEESFKAEFTVRSATQGPGGFTMDAVDGVADADGVAAVMPMTFTDFRYDDKVLFGVGVDPATFYDTMSFDEVSGRMGDLSQGGLAVKESIAEDEGWKVGDVVDIEFASTGVQQVVIRAVFDADVDTAWIFDNGTIESNNRDPQVQQMFVTLADGVTVDEARGGIEDALAAFPTVEVLDQAELQADVQGQVDQLLGLMSALLMLSVIIALFGIINTLGLSVFERIRELGLLRAVGASRRQVRAMIRWESVLIATLGATLGLGIGVLFGWMLTRALADQGISTFQLPMAQLTGAVVAAGIAGVVAAILPARRAARVDVLKALQLH